MNHSRSIIDRFSFEEYNTSASALGLYRILFATYVLFLVLPRGLWVSNFPNSFFNPPVGPTMFFTGFPNAGFFLLINSLSILAAVWLLFGYRTGIASVGLALLWLIGNSWTYSFGKINHDVLLILTLPVMQAAGWGKAYSMDARRLPRGCSKTRPWAVALMALLVALAMFSAAFAKVTTGWLSPHSQAVHAHMLLNYFVTGRANWLVRRILFIHSATLWDLFDNATVLLESAFLLTVPWRPAFRVVCALACFFHLGIAVTMEIAYVANLVVYAAFFDWSVLEPRLASLLRVWNWTLDRTSFWHLLAFSGVIAPVYLRFGNPIAILFPQEWDPVGVVLCAVAALLAILFLSRLLWTHALVRGLRFRRPNDALSSSR